MSRKARRCLMCGEFFDSDGPGNRRCEPCAEKLEALDNDDAEPEERVLLGPPLQQQRPRRRG